MGKTSTFRTTSNREIPKVPLYYGRFELITVWCGCLSLNKTSVFRTTSDSNKTTPLYCGHTSVERCLMRISLRTTSTLRTHSNWTVESNHNLSITNDFGWSLFNVTLSADFRVKKLKKKKRNFIAHVVIDFLILLVDVHWWHWQAIFQFSPGKRKTEVEWPYLPAFAISFLNRRFFLFFSFFFSFSFLFLSFDVFLAGRRCPGPGSHRSDCRH